MWETKTIGVAPVKTKCDSSEEMMRMFEESARSAAQIQKQIHEERLRQEKAQRDRLPAVESLPLFDVNACCPKCGEADVEALYQEDSNLARGACLERHCTRCAFKWPERALDQAHDLELLAREAPMEQAG